MKLFGFGTFAGFLTLTFATIGFNAKLLAEEIEAINPAPAEAVCSTGAGWFSWLAYGIQPQVLPRAIGLAIYRLDINFRESAIIGIVGAGGIGATLTTAFDRYEYDSAAAILVVIIGIVMVTELVSGRVRQMGKVMTATKTLGRMTWRRRTPSANALVWMGWLIGIAVVIVCFQKIAVQTEWFFVVDAPAQGADLLACMFPPEWAYGTNRCTRFGTL